jgi:hypothetical protein
MYSDFLFNCISVFTLFYSFGEERARITKPKVRAFTVRITVFLRYQIVPAYSEV